MKSGTDTDKAQLKSKDFGLPFSEIRITLGAAGAKAEGM